MVKTTRDGRWRALDTMCLRGILGAVQAVVATHAECGLTAEFGVSWVPRPDGAGNEIAGISQELMDAYSTRTVAISEKLPDAVASWTAKYGRAPSRRELLYIRQEVTMATREGKDAGVIDWDALAARWDARPGGSSRRSRRACRTCARTRVGAPAPAHAQEHAHARARLA